MFDEESVKFTLSRDHYKFFLWGGGFNPGPAKSNLKLHTAKVAAGLLWGSRSLKSPNQPYKDSNPKLCTNFAFKLHLILAMENIAKSSTSIFWLKSLDKRYYSILAVFYVESAFKGKEKLGPLKNWIDHTIKKLSDTNRPGIIYLLNVWRQ